MKGFLLTLCLMVATIGLLGCSGDAYGCPPGLQVQQFNAGCHAQQFVAPQAVYAAPLIQQQFVAQPYYQQQLVQRVVQQHAQPVIVQQVRQHHAQAIVVQQVRQPLVQRSSVQVQRSRTVIRNR
jgi:hypothetical protein